MAFAAGAGIACLSLALGGAPFGALIGTVALALGVRPACLILGLSPESIRRIDWTRDGVWHVQDASGKRRTVELLQGSSAVVGPLVLLTWREHPGRSRCRALVDARSTDPRAFSTLLGRLRLEGGGTRGRDRYC